MRGCHWTASLWFVVVWIGLASPALAVQEDADTSWSELYRRDLDAVRRIIATNHPGTVDRRNPTFRRTLRAALDEALDAEVGSGVRPIQSMLLEA